MSDIALSVAPIDLIQGSIEIDVFRCDFRLSLNEEDLSLDLILEGVGDSFGVLLGTDDLGGESFSGWEFQQLVFPDVLGVVVVGEELSLVLDVASDEGGVGVDLLDLVLGGNVVLLWVGKSEVVVFDGGSEEQISSLS